MSVSEWYEQILRRRFSWLIASVVALVLVTRLLGGLLHAGRETELQALQEYQRAWMSQMSMLRVQALAAEPGSELLLAQLAVSEEGELSKSEQHLVRLNQFAWPKVENVSDCYRLWQLFFGQELEKKVEFDAETCAYQVFRSGALHYDSTNGQFRINRYE
ncbi:hypothetical protein [Aliagarivorans marinus]|uniref:hypothetical protein n=1 Tax=Aliagarivorans marinus TaxID=561965 RepID=UPI00041EF519|nr:hypothetical protein [Aliagarivorans marinus]